MVARKENELDFDRGDRDYQELIGYASLDDLAEIIENNEDLAKLLEVIAPKGSTIVEMFREVEALRLKLAAAAPFDDDDVETLYRYHVDFRDALERRMQEKTKKPAPVVLPVETDPVIVLPAEREDETSDEVGDEAAEPELLAKEEVIAAETDRSSEDEDDMTEPDQPDEEEEEEGESSGDFVTAVTESDTAEIELSDVAQAMDDDDDVEVLRVIRGEVMVVAEGVLNNDLQVETSVWDEVQSTGWFDGKKTDLGIEPLEEFYSVVDAVRETRRSGGGLEAIKAASTDPTVIAALDLNIASLQALRDSSQSQWIAAQDEMLELEMLNNTLLDFQDSLEVYSDQVDQTGTGSDTLDDLEDALDQASGTLTGLDDSFSSARDEIDQLKSLLANVESATSEVDSTLDDALDQNEPTDERRAEDLARRLRHR